jgi:D-tyrosyl-tRNA(Tyr) deacylase
MRAVVQRVKEARVRVKGAVKGSIGRGLLVFAGVEKNDTEKDIEYIASKLTGLRVFEDGQGKMNLDIKEAGGGFLVISQFTLLGDVSRGRRPSFDMAERPERAEAMYRALLNRVKEMGVEVAEGVFQAHMEVELINDGPVTLVLDSRVRPHGVRPHGN